MSEKKKLLLKSNPCFGGLHLFKDCPLENSVKVVGNKGCKVSLCRKPKSKTKNNVAHCTKQKAVETIKR